MTLTEAAVAVAAEQVGTHEVRHNSGPMVDRFLAAVGLGPGEPWCCAFLAWVFAEAAHRTLDSNPFPRTGSTLALWDRADPLYRDSNPRVGLVYVLKHSATTGHVGIVESVNVYGAVEAEISGNTNAKGSREGDRVARHSGTPEVSHGGELLGYLDFGRPLPLVVG
jgi:hypothetical protein